MCRLSVRSGNGEDGVLRRAPFPFYDVRVGELLQESHTVADSEELSPRVFSREVFYDLLIGFIRLIDHHGASLVQEPIDDLKWVRLRTGDSNEDTWLGVSSSIGVELQSTLTSQIWLRLERRAVIEVLK